MKLFLAVVLFLLMEGGLYLYLDGPKRGDLRCKALTTLMPVLLGLYGTVHRGGEAWVLFAALCVCLVSDVLIGVHFVAGVFSFLAAHVLLIVHLLLQAQPTPWSIPLWALLYLLLFAYYRKTIPTLGEKRVPLCVYPVFLFGMLSLAAALPFLRPGASSVCLALGALCFTVSDLILADGVVTQRESSRRDHAVMHLYEPAVYLLALSVVL